MGFLAQYRTQLIIGVLILVIVGTLYGYWQYSQNKIDSLSAENSLLKSTVDTQNSTIADLQKSFQDAQKNLDNLNKSYSTIGNTTSDIKDQFTLGVIQKKDIKLKESKYNLTFNTIFANLNKETQVQTYQLGKGKGK